MSRPLYCYLLLSLWITLMIVGMYKYIITVEPSKQAAARRDMRRTERTESARDSKLHKILKKYCNDPKGIQPQNEGLQGNLAWKLQGAIAIIRHGDRGPLTHIRDMDSINCDVPHPTPLLQRYREYVTNATGSGKAPWAQSPGPFHNFPLLPVAPMSACRIGQLTLVGVQQLLAIGTLVGQAYAGHFGWSAQFNQTGMGKADIAANKSAEMKSQKSTDTAKFNLKTPIKESQNKNENSAPKSPDDKSTNTKFADGDIVVHSTRYRRALQSALAFIWSMLGGENGVGGAVAHESPSLAFCFTDCACPAADKYAKLVSHELKQRLETHPAIGDLVVQLSKIVAESPSQISNDPHILEDALLTYLCHSAPLPCVERPVESPKHVPESSKRGSAIKTHQKMRKLLYDDSRKEERKKDSPPLDFDSQMEKEKLGYYQQKLLENADSNYQDVVLVKRNMDGDFNFNGDSPQDLLDVNYSEEDDNKDDNKATDGKPPNTETHCVRKDQATGLFAYTDWEMKQSLKSANLKKVSLLRGYGMVRHIVQYILQMISEGKPKFVLYSGHDKTLQYLSLALGLTPDNLQIQYASRVIVEVYKNNKDYVVKDKKNPRVAPLDFYFRFLVNGVDITDQLSFCKREILKIDNSDRSNPTDKASKLSFLCRVENIIRFTHEDYFSIFNATNFKDACMIH